MTLDDLAWIRGTWRTTDYYPHEGMGDLQLTEIWSPAPLPVMIGYLYGADPSGAIKLWEHNLIQIIDGVPTFFNVTNGVGPTRAPLNTAYAKPSEALRFDNTVLDFPTSVIYRRSGSNIHFTAANDSFKMEMMYEPITLDQAHRPNIRK